jgi:hypothetical protein
VFIKGIRQIGLGGGLGLGVLGLAFISHGAGSGPVAPQTDRAANQAVWDTSEDVTARQVTVFAILATADSTMIDPRLAGVEAQLRKVMPEHGFKLLDVQSKRIGAEQAVTCDLGNGYKARTELVRPLDENGKVELRCSLVLKAEPQFSTLVKTPPNQLFFYERSLKDGSRVLIGVGARVAFR